MVFGLEAFGYGFGLVVAGYLVGFTFSAVLNIINRLR